jgi:hypothetical protein
MCFNTFLCTTCDYEFESVRNECPDSETDEICPCQEHDIYRDEQCKWCKDHKVKDFKDHIKKRNKEQELKQ